MEHIGSDNDLGSARIQIFPGVAPMDAAAHLQPAGVCRQSLKSLLPGSLKVGAVRPVEQNNMPAPYACAPIEPGVKSRVLLGDKIFQSLVPLIFQASAYDLFYFSVVNINTGSEFHNFPLIIVPHMPFQHTLR